ncbi:hypothetical protein BJY01DRAFT_247023 [Aspergillus pseudoustus]|uniref:Uncharacterized protein n=1 Tax=Aspergillus pseudoustus TaxID=1810923 RepID=A0ABR4K4L3_9EURO
MGVDYRSRILSWLSQVDQATAVVRDEDSHGPTKFIFDGISLAKQTVHARNDPQECPQAANRQQDSLEHERDEQSHNNAQPISKRTDSRQSRIEKNGYKRIPRSKTKADRYQYKGKNAQGKHECETTQKKTRSKQRRRHTINEDFHASNVPTSRLTLRSPLNLGIFDKGKRSSHVKTRGKILIR